MNGGMGRFPEYLKVFSGSGEIITENETGASLTQGSMPVKLCRLKIEAAPF
jgi:hypothetical protein